MNGIYADMMEDKRFWVVNGNWYGQFNENYSKFRVIANDRKGYIYPAKILWVGDGPPVNGDYNTVISHIKELLCVDEPKLGTA